MKARLAVFGCALALLQGCGGGGGSSSPPPNEAPTAEAGERVSVTQGSQIRLVGMGMDEEDGMLDDCQWSYRKRTEESVDLAIGAADQCTLTFMAPAPGMEGYDETGTYTFTLTVTDSAGATGTDEVDLGIYAEALQPGGDTATYNLDLAANTINEFIMHEEPCSESPCCLMRIRDGHLDAHSLVPTVPDPATGAFRLLYETEAATQITLFVFADEEMFGGNVCRRHALFSLEEAASESRYTVSVTGQMPLSGRLAQRFDLALTRIQESADNVQTIERLHLYDASRRDTGLAADAAIRVRRFVASAGHQGSFAYADVFAADAASLDKDAVDALGYSQMVYDYLRTQFGLDSYDNRGGSMLLLTETHSPFADIEPEDSCHGEAVPRGSRGGAFFAGQSIGFTEGFPDNDAGEWDDLPLSVSLDVVAHEWGHGVTHWLNGSPDQALVYAWESGALNEAFSDWMGTAVEHHVRGAAADWVMGADTAAIRSLADPTVYGDPAIYKGTHWHDADPASCKPDPNGCNDNCGIHYNSGVGNKMFYLLSVGGTFEGETVAGIGVQNAMRVAFDAHRDYWSSNSDYADARRGMISAAQTLDMASGTSWAASVRAAWTAVGVDGS